MPPPPPPFSGRLRERHPASGRSPRVSRRTASPRFSSLEARDKRTCFPFCVSQLLAAARVQRESPRAAPAAEGGAAASWPARVGGWEAETPEVRGGLCAP